MAPLSWHPGSAQAEGPTSMETIRSAGNDDRNEVLSLHAQAFGESEGPVIARLVGELLEDETAQPLLSLLSERDRRPVGHVLFTRVEIEGKGRAPTEARILCPLAVAPEVQGQGVGDGLVRHALERLADDGVGLVLVLGHPGYYPRFGFQPAGVEGIHAPYPIEPRNADAWMVVGLAPGLVGEVHGQVRCARSLAEPAFWRE